MQRILSITIFITIAFAVMFFMHYYVWIRLVRDTGISGIYRNILSFVILLMGIMFPVIIFTSRAFPNIHYRPVLWIAYFWLGIIMLLVFSFLAIDIVKILIWVMSKSGLINSSGYSSERRKFIAGITSFSASAVVLGAAGYGVGKYLSKAKIKRLMINLSGLGSQFKGFKIIQISDLHIGQLMTKENLAQIVEQVNGTGPDIVAITGDLVDGNTSILVDDISPLRKLKTRYGVYFVTGNHEYYSGVDEWIEELKKMNIIVLQNERVKIKIDDDYFYLAGVPDKQGARFSKEHTPDYDKTLTGTDRSKPLVLLAHQPVQVKQASKYKVDLMLSGHTHGGQIWPFHLLVYLQQPYLKGLYKVGKTNLYVNQGTGCWGPPIRIGSENEITEIVLG